MISSLKCALQPAVTDISIKFDVPSSFKVYQAPEEVLTLFSGDKVVVYGIIKKQKSASDQSLQASVNGTATLKAQILSKPIEFKITFEIPPPSDFQSSFKMPIVHHLASKALICELQGEESWTGAATYKQRKKDIVTLSIESGVVSSHTAYIALDEEQGKLIEGAVTTWDIVATMAQSKESMPPPSKRLFHSMPSTPYLSKFSNSHGFDAKFEAKNESEWSCYDYQKMARCTNSMSSSSPKSIALAACYTHSYRHSHTHLNGHSYLQESSLEPVKFSAHKTSSTSSIITFGTVARQHVYHHNQLHIHSAVPDTLIEQLKLLISLQKAEGFWGLDVFVRCEWLRFLMPLVRENIEEICVTVHTLAYMEIKFPSRRDEWELVARKAEAWLERQTLPDQVNLEELKKETSDYIINNLVE